MAGSWPSKVRLRAVGVSSLAVCATVVALSLASSTLATAAAPGTLTVTGSGDILIHPSLARQAAADGNGAPNFAPMLSDVRDRISKADFSVCHDETAFSAPGHHTKFPHYYVHPALARGIAATGFDECSTASNWTFDKGIPGIRRTNVALSSSGVGHSGGNSTPAASRNRIQIRLVNGIRVTHLSYTDRADSPGVPGKPWAVNRQTPGQIATDARRARQMGAQIVIVSYAIGNMGARKANPRQRRAMARITRGHNVDFVIAHGSHTVQPAQKVNGTWVVYHGNLLSSFFDFEPRMRIGVISHVSFAPLPSGRFAVSELKLYPVASSAGRQRVIDLASQPSSAITSVWHRAYGSVVRAERRAIAQGAQVVAPCSHG